MTRMPGRPVCQVRGSCAQHAGMRKAACVAAFCAGAKSGRCWRFAKRILLRTRMQPAALRCSGVCAARSVPAARKARRAVRTKCGGMVLKSSGSRTVRAFIC
ncbi:hypothetical protein NPIL_466861 [Nephila pilipes]|uniref:Uncharacterized protein n=1 Tax=Nephila pilipes TaxID=299642 RepID=A0A8X6PXR7_NEPPI|nr:hypothetical protein NPIL_466861 [Nephila pilipes]